MYKLMLSDLDETLLIGHHVPQENMVAVSKAREKGVQFVPATGRAYNTVKGILKELDVYDKANEYTVCFNGALIMENKNDTILHFAGLSFEETKEIFLLGEKYDVCIMIFTLDMCYLFKPDPDEVERKIEQNAPFKIVDTYDMDFIRGEKIAKILYVKRDMKYLKNIEKDLEEVTKDRICVSYSSSRYMEFNALGIDKGFALSWLAKYLSIDMKDTIAMGDNYNDVEMIKKAALGVAVACADEEIKALAQYVTINNFDNFAVKEVIEKFILEEE